MSRWSLERWLPRRAQTVLLALPVGTPAAARTAAARAAFVQALDTIDANAGSRIEVVLRDDLLRWQLLPWNAALSNAAQRVALARQAFVRTHGEAGREESPTDDESDEGQHLAEEGHERVDVHVAPSRSS